LTKFFQIEIFVIKKDLPKIEFIPPNGVVSATSMIQIVSSLWFFPRARFVL